MFYDKENNERYLKLDLECPLLSEDKLCSIYNYRPMTCATFRNYGKAKIVCVGFRDMNYLYMTGVKTKLSAQWFYSACLDRKLSEKDIELYSLFLYNDDMTIKLCMRKKVAGNKTGK